jgi:hypothetical protein
MTPQQLVGARRCQESANLVGQVGRPQTVPPGAWAMQVGAEPDRAPAGAVGGVSAVAAWPAMSPTMRRVPSRVAV